MTKTTIAGGAFAITLLLLTVVLGLRETAQGADPPAASSAVLARPSAGAHQGLLYGRVTTEDGDVYEGRLRFGGDEEALWSNYFNGYKDDNPWAPHAPLERLPRERLAWEAFGIELAASRRLDLGRPFMARFGDIVRIEARGRDLWVTLKSGRVVRLDRYAADDYADGVRVWSGSGDVVNLGERQIRSIEFLSGLPAGAVSYPLYGTVHTRLGDFTGFIQWEREACLGSDLLHGHGVDGEISLPFDAIRSIASRSSGGALVTLLDGREIVLSDTRQDGRVNRGMYVDDPRYGRVLVSWDAFERLDFGSGGAGPAYDEFDPGRPLIGTVVTHSGQRFAGRLVYDLDESETTATLDAPSHGVDYMIPFRLIASIEPVGTRGAQGARVRLQSGERLHLERTGDLGELNAGMLIFRDAEQTPRYVPWTEVARIEFRP